MLLLIKSATSKYIISARKRFRILRFTMEEKAMILQEKCRNDLIKILLTRTITLVGDDGENLVRSVKLVTSVKVNNKRKKYMSGLNITCITQSYYHATNCHINNILIMNSSKLFNRRLSFVRKEYTALCPRSSNPENRNFRGSVY